MARTALFFTAASAVASGVESSAAASAPLPAEGRRTNNNGLFTGGGDKMQHFLFRRDVVRRAEQRARALAAADVDGEGGVRGPIGGWVPPAPSASTESALLEVAMPLEEYNRRIVARGGEPIDVEGGSGAEADVPDFMKPNALLGGGGGGGVSDGLSERQNRRRLDDGGDDDGDDDGDGDGDDANNDDGDDYYMDPDYTKDFSGYSLKFATCQKVQRFSSAAVDSKEYSALVADDIVVLRMCPKRRCKESVQYGCYSGYGEYAVGVAEYLRVMMNHEIDKQNNLCGFCSACLAGQEDSYGGYSGYQGRRHLDDGDGDEDDAGDDAAAGDDAGDDYFDENDDGAVAADDDAAAAAAGDDTYVAADDDGGDGGVCDQYSDLCDEYQDTCYANNGDDDADADEDGDDEMVRLEYLDYLNYFDCVNVEGNDKYDYWISPRCDPYTSKITMGLFYDQYCSQYAGNELNLNEVTDIYFQKDIFEDFYSGECVQCATNAYPPYFNSNNNMCNALYDRSAKCNTYFAFDLSANQDDDGDNGGSSSICAFTESIREGTYDATGQVKVRDSFSTGQDATVTRDQIIMLAVSAAVCVLLAVYACFVHHEITNLLLKSLAHGHLISGEGGGGAVGSARRGRSSVPRNRTATEDEDDDDDDDDENTEVSEPSPPPRQRGSRRRGGGGGGGGSGRRSRSKRYKDDDSDWDRGEYA